jgi:hypothetical protein
MHAATPKHACTHINDDRCAQQLHAYTQQHKQIYTHNTHVHQCTDMTHMQAGRSRGAQVPCSDHCSGRGCALADTHSLLLVCVRVCVCLRLCVCLKRSTSGLVMLKRCVRCAHTCVCVLLYVCLYVCLCVFVCVCVSQGCILCTCCAYAAHRGWVKVTTGYTYVCYVCCGRWSVCVLKACCVLVHRLISDLFHGKNQEEVLASTSHVLFRESF